MGLKSSKCEKGHRHQTLEEVKECHEQRIRRTQFACGQGHYHQNENEVQRCNEHETKSDERRINSTKGHYRCTNRNGDIFEYTGTKEGAEKFRNKAIGYHEN